MRLLYSFVYFIGFFLATPYWLVRGLFNPQYLSNLKSRLFGPAKLLPALDGKTRVWVWALSLGEVLAARELVAELEKDGHEVFVTATTLAGLAMAKANWPKLVVLPSPLDFSFSISRFLETTKPDHLVLVETDLWPGVLMAAQKKGLSTALVSARLSPRSFKNYRKIRFFWAKVLQYFDKIITQTQEDQDKFIALGANPEKVAVGGNLKFDQTLPPEDLHEARGQVLAQTGWPKARYLVAGSFHAGEDEMILKIFLELNPNFPDARLILAPRDRRAFAQTYRLAQEYFPDKVARRAEPKSEDQNALVFILDTLGELENFYSLAEIALIGKSWPGRHEGGGHNPLEAAARRRPVICGPKIHNFKWIYAALVAAGGALVIDQKNLAAKLTALLNDPGLLTKMGETGQKFVVEHQGAVRATLDILALKKGLS
ncbi:MAG: hypothetical protein LBI10_10265 [Deltaproteobacteria bacterium]|jgi:3-deoxy-D-manno-octulosonic-acid transferase|nr:hypothetical protein [Deltaproteobacteria bacterium]